MTEPMETRTHENSPIREDFGPVLRALVIVVLSLIGLAVLYRGGAEVVALFREHPGADFWLDLLDHLLRREVGG